MTASKSIPSEFLTKTPQGKMGVVLPFTGNIGSSGVYSELDSEDLAFNALPGKFFEDEPRKNYESEFWSAEPVDNLEEKVPMSPSREEIDAKLDKNRAETEAIAAEMRREMAEFRSFQTQHFSQMQSSFSEIKSQISSVNGELTGLKGQIDGLKTTSSSLQWMVGTILAVLALILALPQIQTYLKPEVRESVEISQPPASPPHKVDLNEVKPPKIETQSTK